MIPIYSPHAQLCNYCEDDIHIGYEFIIHDGMYYCNKECFIDEVLKNTDLKQAYLTDDKMLKEDD